MPGRRLRALGSALAALGLTLALGGAATSDADPEALRDHSFQAAQQAMASEAAEALAHVAARTAQGDDALAALADRRQDLVRSRDRLERELERRLALPGDDGVRLRAEAQAAYAEALTALEAADAEIARRFPDYAALTRPRPLSLAQTQGLLAPDEALVLILVNDEAAYVWAVSSDDVAWARAESLGTDAMAQAVAHLRTSLGVAAARSRPYAPQTAARPDRFDTAAAHALHQALIAPVQSVLDGAETVITVTEGDLATLPLAVLATDPAGARYLIDDHALASLPSVSSLMAVRCLAPGPDDARPAACPPRAASQTRADAGPRLDLAAFGAPLLDGAEAEAGRGPPGSEAVFGDTGDLADVARLRALPRLPGSAAELSALRDRYPSSLVRMGAQATETAVRADDAEALSRARFVVFSTHGLLAGSGQAEPGLVLTPPAVATAQDDGYLSASEAASLRLSAEFVVLSACNTAGGDGQPGAQGLSGLARAFFYAGARSLLVSHWEVSDAATTELITGAFAALDAGDPGARAQALRAAMLAVRSDARWSHPAYWGGFTLVGEPG